MYAHPCNSCHLPGRGGLDTQCSSSFYNLLWCCSFSPSQPRAALMSRMCLPLNQLCRDCAIDDCACKDTVSETYAHGCYVCTFGETAASFFRAFFFHEYGRRVGMVPRSSLKGGKVSQMVEKITRTTNKKPTEHQKGPQAESPPSCSLSSVLGETGETEKSV